VYGASARFEQRIEREKGEFITCTITISTTDGEPFPAQFVVAPASTFIMDGCAAPSFLTRSIGGRTVNIHTDCPGLFRCAEDGDVRTVRCGEGVLNPFLNGVLGNHRVYRRRAILVSGKDGHHLQFQRTAAGDP
jgi:hypothetical protein